MLKLMVARVLALWQHELVVLKIVTLSVVPSGLIKSDFR